MLKERDVYRLCMNTAQFPEILRFFWSPWRILEPDAHRYQAMARNQPTAKASRGVTENVLGAFSEREDRGWYPSEEAFGWEEEGMEGGEDSGILANVPDVMVTLWNEHSSYAVKPGLNSAGDQTQGCLYAG